ncbi:pyridoxal-phosphate dependent enzyme [Streptomyces sp. NPDC005970]|uniref:threonine synthase n=1 Tax=Streptomyces sp. NPDC005970 TaxID=3156723 RepID=UPI0033F053ED
MQQPSSRPAPPNSRATRSNSRPTGPNPTPHNPTQTDLTQADTPPAQPKAPPAQPTASRARSRAHSLSLATGQRSLGDPTIHYSLWPPLTNGCPRTSTDAVAYPLEVDYAYDRVPADLFDRPAAHGLERWAPLLPPLSAPGLGEGNTPLVRLADGVYVKDESRNPTWSHKDRLNRVAVSAAKSSGARGVVVCSSGNHGASAAAYAARAGLPCAVFTSPHAPPAVASFVRAYGATVLTVPRESLRPLARRVVAEFGYHPVSSLTDNAHTGHPFGPEGYKTIAYEIFLDLGETPEAVYVPTGYGELLFGVWKGFHELTLLGLADRVPRLYACEPAAAGALGTAIRTGRPATEVPVGPTEAYGIACPVGGYRGVVAVRESRGEALTVTDEQMAAARAELSAQGMWVELSSAAGLAALRAHHDGPATGPRDAPDASAASGGPVVCIATSSGFKDSATGTRTYPPMPADWGAVAGALSR